ncbi:MAG: prephenate dehydrogenase [Candidatus Omnitrophota bacterium]
MGKFRKIAVIGVGMIGGSIGLAVKKRGMAREVCGICRREVSAWAARKSGAVDTVTMDFNVGLKGADLIIIAAPVGKIVDIAMKVAEYAGRGAIVTDVGSTKGEIVAAIERAMPRHLKFVGGHPMAGSEKSGVSAADPGIFKNSLCILTKTARTDLRALKCVMKFWEGLGAMCPVLSPKLHDRYISFISHLPHVTASGLCAAVEPASLMYASTGFRDTTRIAASDPDLWSDIFLTNRRAVLSSIKKYMGVIGKIERTIRNRDRKGLRAILEKAGKTRGRIGLG